MVDVAEIDPIECDPTFEDCSNLIDDGIGVANSTEPVIDDFADDGNSTLPEEQIEGMPGSFDEALQQAGTASLFWLTVLYYTQVAIVPLLALILWPLGVSLWSAFYWSPLLWLHSLSYLPSAAINSLYLIVGKEETDFTYLLDDTAIFLIVYWSANAGLLTHVLAFNIYLICLILNFGSTGYWVMFLVYTLQAMYMQYFQITHGVEIIRSMQPLWKGTKNGLLFPALLYMIGLVDRDGEALFLSDEEQAQQASEEEAEEAEETKET